MSIGRNLKNWVTQHGRENAVAMFNEALEKGDVDRNKISLRDLAESTMGHDWNGVMRRYNEDRGAFRGTESGDAVDPSTFAAITGNLLIDRVKDKYNSPDFIGDSLVTTIPVTNGNLDKQRVPWLSNVLLSPSVETSLTDDDESIVNAGMEYQRRGFVPNYYNLQRPKKRGGIVAVTFEMIYADRTKQAIDSAENIGRAIGMEKEYRILKVFLGLVNNFEFSYGNGAETNSSTYHVTAGTLGTWINGLNNQPLQSWNDVNAVEQVFAQMRDPNTGQPIEVDADTIFVMPGQMHNAKHILHATELRTGPGGSTSATGNVTLSDNSLRMYNLITSKFAYKLATNASVVFPKMDLTTGAALSGANATLLWLMGNPKRAFYYRQVEGLQMFQAPPMNPEEFNKDIVLQVKAREYGVAGVSDPFAMVRVFGHSFTDATTAA